MPLGVQPRCGTPRTRAVTATAALQAGRGAAVPSGFIHHGRVPAARGVGWAGSVSAPAARPQGSVKGEMLHFHAGRRPAKATMPPPRGYAHHGHECLPPHSELCPPLLPASQRQPPPGSKPCSFIPRVLGTSYLTEGGAESLGLLTSEDRIPREGQRCLPGRILGFGWSISASLDPEWVGENLKSLA